MEATYRPPTLSNFLHHLILWQLEPCLWQRLFRIEPPELAGSGAPRHFLTKKSR